MKVVYYILPSLFAESVLLSTTPVFESEPAFLFETSELNCDFVYIQVDHGSPYKVLNSELRMGEDIVPYVLPLADGFEAVLPFMSDDHFDAMIQQIAEALKRYDDERNPSSELDS